MALDHCGEQTTVDTYDLAAIFAILAVSLVSVIMAQKAR
jgi:uncharacterized protein (DUF983 family)